VLENGKEITKFFLETLFDDIDTAAIENKERQASTRVVLF
jgi:hypothetical protein